MSTPLRGRARFTSVRRSRARATSGDIRVHALANGLGVVRPGFAITGVRTAVERNLARRRLRSALQERVPELVGLDLVVAARLAGSVPGFDQLRAQLFECLDEVAP